MPKGWAVRGCWPKRFRTPSTLTTTRPTNDGAQVINMSLGSTGRTQLPDSVAKLAARTIPAVVVVPTDEFTDPGNNADKDRCGSFVGAVVVAAAGNDGTAAIRRCPAVDGRTAGGRHGSAGLPPQSGHAAEEHCPTNGAAQLGAVRDQASPGRRSSCIAQRGAARQRLPLSRIRALPPQGRCACSALAHARPRGAAPRRAASACRPFIRSRRMANLIESAPLSAFARSHWIF